MVDESYYALPPKQQLFYTVMAFTLSMVGIHWYEWWGFEFRKSVKYFLTTMYYGIIICAPSCAALQCLYVFVHWNNIAFSTHGTLFTILPTTVLIMFKILSAQLSTYRKLMKMFLDEIHLYNFRSNLYMKERAIEAEKYTRYLCYFFFVFLVIDWALWTTLPIVFNSKNIDDTKNKTLPFQTCFYMWLPYDYEYDFKNWVVVHTIDSILIAIGCTVTTAFDTTNYSIVFHLIGHVKSLKHLIETNLSDHSSDSETKQKLVEVIRYHSFVLRIFRDTEKAFGINVTGNYLYNLLADSLLLYNLLLGEKVNRLMYGFMLLVFLGGLIVMSLILEEVRRQTYDIPQSVYDMPWEKMSIPNQKIVLAMLARTQPTLEYKGAGGLRAGVNPAMQILKSTFSYYVMLKSSL